MEFNNFKDLFTRILQIKKFVVKLNGDNLRNFKKIFYNQNFPAWRLDLMWEFIFDDIDYETMSYVFKNNRII